MRNILDLFMRKAQTSTPVYEEEPRTVPAASAEKQAYSSDQPIESKRDDRFGRWPFAQRLAVTIAKRTDSASLVLGLFGEWGDGKTSTLRMMEEALQSNAHVVVVRFNPWHFGSEQQLLQGFFATLSDSLGQKLSRWSEDLGRVLKKYGSILSVASLDRVATGIGETLSTVELDELRTRVEAFLRDSGSRVVILIDDIDRLDRDEIHAIFKLVKLSASFERITYVLAFDDEMVAAALGEKYGGGGTEAGRSFLEKIIQVPLHLPSADKAALREIAFKGADDALALAGISLTYEQVEAFTRHFVIGVEPQLSTPRQAKLYGNALAFALPLLKDEANPVDLMLIEAMRIFYPKLYFSIRDNPSLWISPGGERAHSDEHRRKVDEFLDGALDQLDPAEKLAVRRGLLEPLFPRTSKMGYGPEWDANWSRDQRICASDYFKRFFTYSVPPGDLGDQEVGQLLSVLCKGAPGEEVDQHLREFAERRAIPRLIEKLRRQEDQTDETTAARLMLAIVRNGSLLATNKGMESFSAPRAQGAVLIYKLLKRCHRSAY